MKTEQQLIDDLRKRKIRIAAYFAAVLISSIALALAVKAYEHGMAIIHELSKVHPDVTITPEAFMQTIPDTLSRYAEFSITISRSNRRLWQEFE